MRSIKQLSNQELTSFINDLDSAIKDYEELFDKEEDEKDERLLAKNKTIPSTK